MGKKNIFTRPDHCQNCGYHFDDRDHYCPQCGQKALPEHLNFKYFIQEFLNNYFSFDSKFFNTLKPLLFKPAFLTSEFIEGRRIRYINPIQLFIFSSFLYFLVNSFMFLKDNPSERSFVTMTDKGEKAQLDSMKIHKQDSIYIFEDEQNADTIDNEYIGDFVQKSQEFNQLDKQAQNEKVSKVISYAVFILMPLFAVYIGWFFSRRDRKYLENLVFSLHFHAFYFISGAFLLLVERIITDNISNIIHLIVVLLYMVLAFKTFAKFSWWSTLIRFVGILVVYGFTVSVVVIASILISILI